MSAPTAKCITAPPGEVRVGAEQAVDIATEFLVMHVGDLLAAGTPRLGTDRLWIVPILVGNAAQGMLGEVGTLRISAEDGSIIFSDADRAEVEARAEQLVTASPF